MVSSLAAKTLYSYRMDGTREENGSQGLKPAYVVFLNVQAKAWTYLRSKNTVNGLVRHYQASSHR